jgi:glucose/arabinose dehydrogenase
VLEQAGRIRVIRNGQLDPQPYLDISNKVGSSGNEQGLLGIAFHPDFAANGYFYVNYTDVNGNTVIARFHAGPDPAPADPASETQILFAIQPYPNHNGGGLAFGPDGMLYVALGDGGLANDPFGSGQSLDTLLGKVLRLDMSQEPYAIPPDNPFVSGGGLPEIWAYGLRNPWRITFDSLTGDFYIADVGQGEWEEVNFQEAGIPGGLNYGWDYLEGFHSFEGTPPDDAALVDPVTEYNHGSGCSVSGGYVYRGESLGAWQGVYLFGDYCTGLVWGLLRAGDGSWQKELLFQTGLNISSFGTDEAGEIYLLDLNGGIYRLEAR